MSDDTMERLVDVVNELKIGKFKAKVMQNTDAPKPGWLLLQPVSQDGLGTSNQFWAEPCVPMGGPDSHTYWIPDVNAVVWYEYAGGDNHNKVWTGCTWPDNHTLADADVNPPGKLIRFGDLQIIADMDAGTLVLQSGENTTITLSSDTIELKASNIVLSAEGKEVKLSASGLDALNGTLKVSA